MSNSSAEINIRSATKEDLAILRTFEQGVIDAERPFAQNLRNGDIHYYDLERLLYSDVAQLLVAEADQKLCASGYIKIETEKPHFFPESFAYIGFLYVVPEKRGSGIILQLVESLMQWAGSRGITSFKLDVYAQNSSAIKAYEKLGFKTEMVQMLKLEKTQI